MDYSELTRDEVVVRLKAELRVRAALEARGEMTADRERLLHDLQTHQLELEAQNRALRETQSQLEESRQRYVDLYDFAPIAYCTFDRDGIVREINLAGAALFGKERSRIIGKPVLALVHFDHPDAWVRHIQNSLAVQAPVMNEITFTTDRGRSEIQLVSVAVRDLGGMTTSCFTALLDITERRAAERSARLAAERLESAVESVDDAFALFDASDHLVLCNSAYRQLLGASLQGAAAGKSYAELLDVWMTTLAFSDDRERELFRSARLSQRHVSHTAFDVQVNDGRRLRVMDRRTPEGGLVKTIWDLTIDMQREAQLKQARAAADSASTAKNEFLSSMSHELRTPLNAILGFAQLLVRDKKDVLSPRHKERVAHILTGGEHLLRLISDVLDLSRIEIGGLSMSLEAVSIVEVLDEVRQTLEPAAAHATVRIETAFTANVPAVRADRTRLTQILLNFGSNAIKYNRPDGSLTFNVSVQDATCVRVTVADTGLGIPFDKQAKVFEPFQRAGQETGPIEGTGIGLAISKRFAELMHGNVGFRSVPSAGSEFWIELPIHVGQHAASAPPAAQEPSVQLPSQSRGLVLYVEDNPANVRLMCDLLGAFEGIELVTAATAELGLALARANPPNVVILDINLPGMSGFEALRVLQESPETAHVPVIALTATASELDRQRGLRLGFYRYMAKPVDVADLEATLKGVFARPLAVAAVGVE